LPRQPGNLSAPAVESTLDLVGRADEAGEKSAGDRGDGSDDGDDHREVEVEGDAPDVATTNGQTQAAEDEQSSCGGKVLAPPGLSARVYARQKSDRRVQRARSA